MIPVNRSTGTRVKRSGKVLKIAALAWERKKTTTRCAMMNAPMNSPAGESVYSPISRVVRRSDESAMRMPITRASSGEPMRIPRSNIAVNNASAAPRSRDAVRATASDMTIACRNDHSRSVEIRKVLK